MNTRGWLIRRATPFVVAGFVAVGHGPAAHAAEPDGWVVSPDLGLSLAPGTEDRWMVRAGLMALRRSTVDEISFGGEVALGETMGETSSETFGARLGYDRFLSENFFVGLAGDWLRDGQADLDSRVTASGSLGWRAFESANTTLGLELGPAFVLEEQAGGSDSYFAGRLAQRFRHRLSEHSSVWQRVEVTPQVTALSNTMVTAEVGLETRLTDQVSLRTTLRNRYDGEVPTGIDHNDLSVFTSLALTLGAPPPSGDASVTVAPPSSPWKSSAALGFALQNGNSGTLGLDLDWNGSYGVDAYEVLLDAGGSYGEVDEAVSTKGLVGGMQFNLVVADPIYLGASARGRHDTIANIDYRVDLAPLAGGYLVRNDWTTVALELGPGYTFEKVAGAEVGYPLVVVGERIEHRFNDALAVWHALRYLGDAENFANSRVEGEVGFDIQVTEGFGLRLGLQSLYSAEPAPGAKKNELRLITGIRL